MNTLWVVLHMNIIHEYDILRPGQDRRYMVGDIFIGILLTEEHYIWFKFHECFLLCVYIDLCNAE